MAEPARLFAEANDARLQSAIAAEAAVLRVGYVLAVTDTDVDVALGSRDASPSRGIKWYEHRPQIGRRVLVFIDKVAGRRMVLKNLDEIVAPEIPEAPGGSSTYVNVMDFGAKADGATDDWTAFRDALDELTEGGVLFMPRGTYRLSRELEILVDKITIMGEGEGTVLKLVAGVHTRFFYANRRSHLTFRDFKMDGEHPPTMAKDLSSPITDDAIYCLNSKYCRAINITCVETCRDGIAFRQSFAGGSVGCQAIACRFIRCREDGLTLNGERHLVSGCYFEDIQGDATLWKGVSDSAITNCYFRGHTAAGISLGGDAAEGNVRLTISNCVIDGKGLNVNPGVKVGSGIFVNYVTDSTITNCVLIDSQNYGMHLAFGSDNVIANNTIMGSVDHGIRNLHNGNVIEGNRIRNVGGAGIQNGTSTTGVVNTVVKGNIITAPTTYGIRFQGAGGDVATVTGNVITGSVGAGIRVETFTDMAITGNAVTGATGAGAFGIQATTGCDRIACVGNSVNGNASGGTSIAGAGSISVNNV